MTLVRRILLALALVGWAWPILAADLPTPPGLSPRGLAWFDAYKAADAKHVQCGPPKPGTFCDHSPPPLLASEEVYWLKDAGLLPLESLDHADALALARYFAARPDIGNFAGDSELLQKFAKSGSMPGAGDIGHPPPGLSTTGMRWLETYVAADAATTPGCGPNPAVPSTCRHSVPPIQAGEAPHLEAAGVAPLMSLSTSDAVTLARFFLSRTDMAKVTTRQQSHDWNNFRVYGSLPSLAPAPPSFLEKQASGKYLVGWTIVLAALVAAGILWRVKAPSGAWFAASGIAAAFFYVGVGGLFLHPGEGYPLLFNPLLWFVAPLLVIGFLKGRKFIAIQKAVKAGYRTPIEWKNNKIDFVTPRLLRQRSTMAPFTVWYVQGGQDGGEWPGHWNWLSATDGNLNLQAPPFEAHFLQMWWKGQRELRLYMISEDTARNLHSGPYGRRQIEALNEAGKPLTLTIHAGTRGAFTPPAERPVSPTHGGAEEDHGSKLMEEY